MPERWLQPATCRIAVTRASWSGPLGGSVTHPSMARLASPWTMDQRAIAAASVSLPPVSGIAVPH